MATVTGMTAAAMQAIRDGTVVNAAFDSANHLILTKYDGTQIDAGVIAAASTAASGLVELATSAETQTGTDAVRAVTPAGLASIPGAKVQHLGSNTKTEAQTYADYPTGLSTLYLTNSSGWSINSGFGTVLTINLDSDRCHQTFHARAGGSIGNPKVWYRSYHSSDNGGGWTAWHQADIPAILTAASFTQTTVFTSYPSGWSRLYYTSSGTGWDFSGTAGEVMTYVNGTDFAEQRWTSHASGSGIPETWIRTANAASGWTAWRKIFTDPGAWVSYTPTWTTSSGIHLPSFGNAVLDCRSIKLGRKVEVRFEVTFGSSTNFGATPATSDNWDFSLPYAAARSGDSIGFVQLQQTNDAICIGRARTVSTTTFRTGISSGMPNAVAIANTGDVDSLSPFTWANGNSFKGHFTYESAS